MKSTKSISGLKKIRSIVRASPLPNYSISNIELLEAEPTLPSVSKFYIIIFTQETSVKTDYCILVVMREGKLIYINLCGFDTILVYIDSVVHDEANLMESFPYGKIGMDNRIEFFLDRVNHIRPSKKRDAVIQILKKFELCFPEVRGFG